MTDLSTHPQHQFQPWIDPVFAAGGIEVHILRGDLFHPWIQGNKWYKLRNYARQARQQQSKGFLSIGGAWSNHLLALASYASEAGLKCRFLIRGERKEWEVHPPIRRLQKSGVELIPVSRTEFREITATGFPPQRFKDSCDDYTWVPLGASSAGTIADTADWARHIQSQFRFTDLVIPAASGGTCAGMLSGLEATQRVHAIDVLGSKGKLAETVENLCMEAGSTRRAELVWHGNYDFGGYAGTSDLLKDFIDKIYAEHNIPTEHVYSGKTFFAVSDLAAKNYFFQGSKILCIHTGGIFNWNSMF